MMQMDSFNFWVMIRVLELISELNHSTDSFILIKLNTLSPYPKIVSVHWITSAIHFIGHIIMMQMDSFNFGFDSGSRAHFRSDSFQRFIYLIKIQHFVHVSGED